MCRGSDESAKRPRAWMSWSSGKDSALALHEVRSANEVDVIGLVTTVNSTAGRVAMHAVRRVLLEAQADALGLPLYVVDLPWPSANELYEQRMSAAVEVARQSGVECFVFGDLFLEDVRAYRLAMLEGTGITPLFPLWRRATNGLAQEMLVQGIKAVITCVDPAQAPRSFAGRWYDEALLAELPAGIDPCGENGEFHTFVVDGPGFAHPLEVAVRRSPRTRRIRLRRCVSHEIDDSALTMVGLDLTRHFAGADARGSSVVSLCRTGRAGFRHPTPGPAFDIPVKQNSGPKVSRILRPSRRRPRRP